MITHYCLLLLLICTSCYSMDRSLEKADFWDRIEIDQRDQEIQWEDTVQKYLADAPLCCPISRRNCFAALLSVATFAPPVIVSQPALGHQLISLPIGPCVAAAGLTAAWSIYELKKLLELIQYGIYESNKDDIFEEFD